MDTMSNRCGRNYTASVRISDKGVDGVARTVRVDVNPEVLLWAVENSGRKTQIARQIPMLDKWLSGEVKPTLRQLEDLAKKAYVPLGTLFLLEPPEEKLPIPSYRTFGDDFVDRPSRNLLDTVRMMVRRQSWLREYLIEDGALPKGYVGAFTFKDDYRVVADDIRETLNLPDNWAQEERNWENALVRLFGAAEDAGIMVVRNGVVENNTFRRLDPEEFRGFVLVDEYAPLVFINGTDYKAAQMFTLAHELAHIWLGTSAVFDLALLQPADHDVERACNAIAGEFLVPQARLLEEWRSVDSPEDAFHGMARQFKVSPLVVARRALDLQLVSKYVYDEFYREYISNIPDREASDGGDFYRNQNYRVGRLFLTHVVTALREDRLLYRDAYQLTGLRGETFSRYAAQQVEEV